jgi:Domain of unknown function (DUF4185)
VVGLSALPASRRKDGKLADITGPGITDRWGVTCTDLGASITAPDGTLVSVFGDTFSGNRVGEGEWRSPVILIGTGDANRPITYQRAGGPDPEYAHQLWRYPHRTVKSGRPRRGISTVIPSDLLRVGDALYLHAIVNRGFGNVVWTEIWRSDDSGISWRVPTRSSRPDCTTATRSAGREITTRPMTGSTSFPPAFSVTRGSSSGGSVRNTSATWASTPGGDEQAVAGRGGRSRPR